jgi:very-short-patch-repair endonuclease
VRTGWRVLRFANDMLVNRPQYVPGMIRAALGES